MTKPQAPRYRPVRFAIFLSGNLCLALYMLFTIPMLHQGRKGFVPHASIDKDYVNAVISSGEAEGMHKALKITEIARAGAYEDYVAMMGLLQFAAAALAVLFVLNTVFLFRLRQPLKALARRS